MFGYDNEEIKAIEREEIKAIERIEYAKYLYDAQTLNVKKEKYIQNLLLEDYVRSIRSNLSRYDFIDNVFKAATSQIDKKLKRERQDLETVKQFIMEDFLNSDKEFKLTKIFICGYEGYAYNVEFEGYNTKFYIGIPIKNKLTTKNVESAFDGMFNFSIRETECSTRCLCRSYKVEDIAKSIKEYFKLEDRKEE